MSNPNQIENHFTENSQQAVNDNNKLLDSIPYEQDLNQAESEPNKVYSRQHADGMVHEGTVEAALKQCTPMLGKPHHQVSNALKAAEIGKTLREAAKARADISKKAEPKKSSDNKKDTVEVQLKRESDKADTASDLRPHSLVIEAQPKLEFNQLIVPRISTTPHKEVFVQNVRLVEIFTEATLTTDKLKTDATLDFTVSDIINESIKTTAEYLQSIEETSDLIPQITNTETIHEAPINEQSDQVFESVLTEIEPVKNMDLMSGESPYVPLVESEAKATTITFRQDALTMEAIADRPVETEFIVMPEQSEVYEEVEKTPAVAVAEFILQVLPAVTQEVYERVQEMEPEAAAEVAAQIETISIVADRLHELVVQGKTDGEEAKQIEAYLKREYEQLLVAVGIESTEEILKEFIRYIYSAEYQIREDINLKELEIIDEGTHEKKLFDEQGVFSRAHAASLDLSRRLDKSIGQLVVNYFSS